MQTLNKKWQSLIGMIQSPYLPISICISELKSHYDIEPVRDAIFIRLDEYPDTEIMFYIPQLCYFFVSQPNESISKY